ncbi:MULTISPECIES: Na(+)/H(+) antiporter subunit B [Peribacillus]|uniref:Na(+)/H(+) antiporter subunit B n=1 Tax=Peribacillus butanolivorans TaxID=421767 RepID=A0AAX0S1I6_9BACI|nr:MULTISPECIES: Na(+)/H(+) antiporter subunit B [Peribacillus]KRF67130.1 cation:proton antiporter [Bacillus sp. Soil768D1]AXN38589.1 Na(+)/H(+) antiporter subunit B [Peribacillus butanolivorans]MBK5485180.1 Na(+)/H(+) antiporter subunit B [Peribacillus sp. TH16]PEJ32576.1 Na(+)/H(+) antiporter subunit B [Peribacillus butanolivorans]QNU02928.1 Na(+)/H(+) antiporter subunit B [Peribacillus butanolivorans]
MKQNDLILQTVTKVAAFVILLFAVAIFLGGHYSPGGGFVGGLMTSAAIVLLLLAYDIKTVTKILPIDYKLMIGSGLFISSLTVAGGLVFGVPLMTHAYRYIDLPILGHISLHTAVLFDLGVYLVVVGVTMTIIQTIGESE